MKTDKLKATPEEKRAFANMKKRKEGWGLISKQTQREDAAFDKGGFEFEDDNSNYIKQGRQHMNKDNNDTKDGDGKKSKWQKFLDSEYTQTALRKVSDAIDAGAEGDYESSAIASGLMRPGKLKKHGMDVVGAARGAAEAEAGKKAIEKSRKFSDQVHKFLKTQFKAKKYTPENIGLARAFGYLPASQDKKD